MGDYKIHNARKAEINFLDISYYFTKPRFTKPKFGCTNKNYF